MKRRSIGRSSVVVRAPESARYEFVGVANARLGVGDQEPVRAGIGDGLGGVEARRPGRELQQTERHQQQTESAEKGQNDQHPGNDQRTDWLRRQPKREDRAGEANDQKGQDDRIGGPLNSVHRRRGRRRFHRKLKPQGHCLREQAQRVDRRAASASTLLDRCLDGEGPVGAQMRRKLQFSTGSHFVMSAASARLEPHWAQRRTCEAGRLRSAHFHRCASGRLAAVQGSPLGLRARKSGLRGRRRKCWMWHAMVE